MITNPVYIDVPVFATLGTKVEPDASVFTNGYAVDTILPTEHLSYFFNGFTSNDITVEDAVEALIVELTSILTAAGITPNPLITNQILLSLNSLYVNTSGGSSIGGTTTVTGTLTSSGGSMTGTWAGSKTFSGSTTISGTLTSSGGTLSGTWAGSPTFSAQVNFNANISLGSSAGILENSVSIKRKVLNIGDWNMDTTDTVQVAHGLTFAKIRGVRAYIINDISSTLLTLNANDGDGAKTGTCNIFATGGVVNLSRVTGGAFDNTGFDSTSFNRGFIIIEYEA